MGGKVDLKDAIALIRILVGLDPMPADRRPLDVNCDGAIDLRDVLLILKFILGKVARLSCCGG